MVIGDRMEILLSIERAAQKERKVAVCRLDDVGNLVDCLTPIKGVLIREAVLDNVSEHDTGTQCLGHTRKKGRIHDGGATRIGGWRRHLPITLGLRGSGTNTRSGGRRWNGLINKRTHVGRRGGGQRPRTVLQGAIATEGGRHRAGGV
jgi:hypothetical protein